MAEKRLIGYVRITGGNVMVCDPVNIDNEWTDEDYKPRIILKEIKTGKILTINPWTRGMTLFGEWKDGVSYNEGVAKGLLVHVSGAPTENFSYVNCVLAVAARGSGEIGKGLGVACEIGHEDGKYPVYAYMDKCGLPVRLEIDFSGN